MQTPQVPLRRQLDRLLARLERTHPELQASVDDDKGVCLTSTVRSEWIPWSRIRPAWSASERRGHQAASRSFVDLHAGIVHVAGPKFYLHSRNPGDRGQLSAQQCALLAMLCEMEPKIAERLICGPGEKLRRRLESIVGAPIQKMAITRMRSSLQMLSEINLELESKEVRFDRSRGLEALLMSFSLKSIGAARTFPVSSPDDLTRLVKELYPGCIEGVSRLIRESGAHINQRDAICSRETSLAIRKQLGPAVGARYTGRTVIIRTASRVSVALLAGKAGRDCLNPVLAAAATRSEPGILGPIGEELWNKVTASR